MLDIAPEKVAHIIVLARELDSKVGAWDGDIDENDPDSILEARANDPLEAELREFIADLNVDEQVSLVALMWVGRGTYAPLQIRYCAFIEETGRPGSQFRDAKVLIRDFANAVVVQRVDEQAQLGIDLCSHLVSKGEKISSVTLEDICPNGRRIFEQNQRQVYPGPFARSAEPAPQGIGRSFGRTDGHVPHLDARAPRQAVDQLTMQIFSGCSGLFI